MFKPLSQVHFLQFECYSCGREGRPCALLSKLGYSRWKGCCYYIHWDKKQEPAHMVILCTGDHIINSLLQICTDLKMRSVGR